jgi:hypothetical protein
VFLSKDLVCGLIGVDFHFSGHCIHPAVAVFGRGLRRTQLNSK